MPEEGLRPQKRGRKIAMTGAEIDEFLAAERTARVATVDDAGPHVTALWFVWDGKAAWLYSITRSRRWADLRKDPRIALLVDAGEDYDQLRGVEITGTVEVVGEVPRNGEDDHPELAEAELLMARKYMGGDQMFHDGRHAWLKLTPDKITSWDFRKLASLS
jgi:hypothetical protein